MYTIIDQSGNKWLVFAISEVEAKLAVKEETE